MDMNLLIPVICVLSAVVILIGVAAIGRRATLRAQTWWVGLACLPIAALLTGMVPFLIDGWNSIATWWQGLTRPFEPVVMAGLVVGGLGLLLLFGSRLIPYKKRTPKVAKTTTGATAVRPVSTTTPSDTTTTTTTTF